MLKVWGRATSANTQKVMWAIGELGLPHERIDIGGPYGGNDKPEYLAMNPNGVVPTLQEDDFLVWESNSCLRYIASKYGPGRLEPSDLRERASAHRWMDWQLTTFGPAMFNTFLHLVRMPPEQRDMKLVEESRTRSAACVKILDRYLGETAYLAGDNFSMGDMPCAILTYRYFRLTPDHPPFDNVSRWYAAIEKRPAYQQHVLQIPFV